MRPTITITEENAKENGMENIINRIKELTATYPKDHLFWSACSVERILEIEQKTEFNVPYELVGDIALYATIDLGGATASVTKNNLKEWRISKDELFYDARQNTLRTQDMPLQSMGEMVGMPWLESPFKVLTNREGCRGASNFFLSDKKRSEWAEELGGDYYMIPSSIHEVLLLPAEGFNPKDLVAMVNDVNGSVVADEDRLSCHVFKYSAKDHELTVAA